MILDQIDSGLMYGGLGERIAAGLALLADERVRNAPPGRHEVQADDLFFVVAEYTTKPAVEALPEIHRRYLDIQCVLRGQEYIGHTLLDGLIPDQPYDAEKDTAFYRVASSQTLLHMNEGMFAIFWPNEPHAPGISIDGPISVRKVVVKVRME